MELYDRVVYTPMQWLHIPIFVHIVPRSVRIGGSEWTIITANRVTFLRSVLLLLSRWWRS